MGENNEVQEYGYAESFNYTYADKFAMEDEYSRHIYIKNPDLHTAPSNQVFKPN